MSVDPLTIARANARVLAMRGGRKFVPKSPFPARLRSFMSGAMGLVLSTLMGATADASQGIRPDITDRESEKWFGCTVDELPDTARRVVVVRAGGRGGKTSRLLAGKAIHAAFDVDLPTLAAGEHAWSLIVAPDKTLAAQALSFVRGYFETSPDLLKHVVNKQLGRDGALRIGTTEVITIRRPHDGKLVDIRVGVASAGGKWARGKTFVFVGFDEAAFFQSEEEKVANDRELFKAAIQRIVPGAQLWMLSTPYIAGMGKMEEEIGLNWGHHSKSLIVQAPTRDLNPTWDPDHTIEDHLRATDPDNAAREIDAIPYPAGSRIFFSPECIALAVEKNRPQWLPPLVELDHFAAGDFGFARNSSAMAIARRATTEEYMRGRRVTLVFLTEAKPNKGEPLKPSLVCAGFAQRCAEYRAWTFQGDMHYAETAREELPKVKGKDREGRDRSVNYLPVQPTTEWTEAQFLRVRRLMSEGRAEIPDDPRLIFQLSRVVAKPMPGGTFKIVLPSMGSTHGDYALAVVMALARVDSSEPSKDENKPKKKKPDWDRATGGGF